MADILTMILLLVACFTAAILNLAVDSGFRRKMTGGFIAAALTIGILSYGYGYARVQGLNFTSLIRALLAVCRMFVGVNDLGSIQEAPLFSRPAVQALFWTGHFMAYYVMASTAIAAVGERLMRRIRTTLLRRGPLLLIYGISADSVAYGRRMAQEKRVSVLYVDEDYNQVFDSAIKAFGGVVEKSSSALEANERFLRQIGFKPGKRRLELAALDPDGRKNLEYARALLDAMNARGIRPEQTSLIAAGAGESASALQTLKEAGYGSVYAFDEYELTARMMIREHPPCGLISFDENGKAEEDFHAVLLGFGRMGRAVLNQLILNGQFHGSRFQVDVFDPDAQNGYLHDQPMMREYDIRFHRISGAAEEFYAFWEEHLKEIRMIVLCTGDQRKNQELAEDLVRWYPWDESPPDPVRRGGPLLPDDGGRAGGAEPVLPGKPGPGSRTDGRGGHAGESDLLPGGRKPGFRGGELAPMHLFQPPEQPGQRGFLSRHAPGRRQNGGSGAGRGLAPPGGDAGEPVQDRASALVRVPVCGGIRAHAPGSLGGPGGNLPGRRGKGLPDRKGSEEAPAGLPDPLGGAGRPLRPGERGDRRTGGLQAAGPKQCASARARAEGME